MSGQFIPPPGQEPRIPDNISFEERFGIWCDLLQTGEEILLAGLRERLKPDESLEDAYRDWQRRYYAQKDRDRILLAKRMKRIFGNDAS